MQANQLHQGLMQSVDLLQNKLGGGEGIEGLYGSLTRTGMQRILDSLTLHCGLGSDSRLVDIGAGLCRYLEPSAGSKCSQQSLAALAMPRMHYPKEVTPAWPIKQWLSSMISAAAHHAHSVHWASGCPC